MVLSIIADGPSVKAQTFNQCDSIVHILNPKGLGKSLMLLPGKVQSTWLYSLKYFPQKYVLADINVPSILIHITV